ncbi:hypothetical protein VTJ83DRAFT_2700 [Remersonia thermophila]|uniref:F-box domain-containing protein n=1 Tax=Remersonia thermophila TaxID=72144 RepID=A0ABR4DKZ5_9PEZI
MKSRFTKDTNRHGLKRSTPISELSIRRQPESVEYVADGSEFSADESPLLRKSSHRASKLQPPTREQPQRPQHLVPPERESCGGTSPWVPEGASTPNPKDYSCSQNLEAPGSQLTGNTPATQIQNPHRNLLLALPAEVLRTILVFVLQHGQDKASLARLARTCRDLAKVVRPVLYRTISDDVEVQHRKVLYSTRKKALHRKHGAICGQTTTAGGHGIITKYCMRLYQALHSNTPLAKHVDSMSLRPAYRHDQPWSIGEADGHRWWMDYLHYLDCLFQLDLFASRSRRLMPSEPAIMLSIALLAPHLTHLDLTADFRWGPTDYLLRRAADGFIHGPHWTFPNVRSLTLRSSTCCPTPALSVDLGQIGPLLYMVPNVEELVMVSPKGEWDATCRPRLFKLASLILIQSFVTYKGLLMLLQACPNLAAFSARNNAIKLAWNDPTCPAEGILRALHSLPGKLERLSLVPYQPQRDFRPPILPHPTRQTITYVPRFASLRSLALDCRLLSYRFHREIGALSQTLRPVHALQELHLHYPWEITDTAFAGFVVHATQPCPYPGPIHGRGVGWWPRLGLVEAVMGVEEFSPGYVFGIGIRMVTRRMTPGQGVVEAANAAAGEGPEAAGGSPFAAHSAYAENDEAERWEPPGRFVRMPRWLSEGLSSRVGERHWTVQDLRRRGVRVSRKGPVLYDVKVEPFGKGDFKAYVSPDVEG